MQSGYYLPSQCMWFCYLYYLAIFRSLIVRGRKLLWKQFPVVDIDLGSPLSLALVVIAVSCSFVISSYDSISAGCASSFDIILCRRLILEFLLLKSRGWSWSLSLDSVIPLLPFRLDIIRTPWFWVISRVSMSLAEIGSHAHAAYSRWGRHKDLYAINLAFSGAQYSARLIIPICFLAQPTLSAMWVLNFKSVCRITPRYYRCV